MRCLLPATVSRSRGPTRRLGILLRSCQSFAFAKRLVTRRRLAGDSATVMSSTGVFLLYFCTIMKPSLYLSCSSFALSLELEIIS